MLPANLSAIGSIALLGWLFTTVGAVALALVFAKLASIDPAAGRPYAYTRSVILSVGQQSQLHLRSRSVAPPDAPAAVEQIVPGDQQ